MPNNVDPRSAERRVVENYFRTTSEAGVLSGKASLEASVEGLRRRLGTWLDVAGKDVLDLGSGTGELCYLARGSGARDVVGVNLSAEEIVFAKERTGEAFVNDDVHAYLLDRPTNSVDVIFALNILEHLDKTTLLIVLEEARRCLRPGGHLVAMVPNATSPFSGMTRYWDVTHQLAFTPASVQQLARYAGFSSWEFRECGPIPHGLLSACRYLAWRVVRRLIWVYLYVELASAKGGIYSADMLFRLANRSQ
jgi:SAM-dependent methyltransferase